MRHFCLLQFLVALLGTTEKVMNIKEVLCSFLYEGLESNDINFVNTFHFFSICQK